MGPGSGLIIVVTLALFLLFYRLATRPTQSKEKFTDGSVSSLTDSSASTSSPSSASTAGSANSTASSVPGLKGIAEDQGKYNTFSNLINLVNPQIPFTQQSAQAVDRATNTPLLQGGGLPGAGNMQAPPVSAPYKIPTSPPQTLEVAQQVCEKVTTTDCTAFADPTFAANCGISFDLKGINSLGKKHVGGLYISPEGRQAQLMRAASLGLSPDDVQYMPTIGKASKGTFAIDASSCAVISQQLACKSSHIIGSGNCAQCFTSSDFARVDPSTPLIPPSFILQTNATSLTIQSPYGTMQVPAKADTPITVDISGLKEGDTYFINVAGSAPNLYLSGYITSKTAKGAFNLDLNALIDLDTVTNYKPRICGSQVVGSGINCTILCPAMGQQQMNLRGNMPFSFVSPYQYDARNCDNGPFITQQASATFLGSDACYSPNAKPGAYSLQCLQQTFVSIGGTTSGTGYPSDATTAKALLYDSTGKARTLSDITNYLYGMNVAAATGIDVQGKSLTQKDWNAASMFCTGKPILGPCDLANKATGPLTAECIKYLYVNGGTTDPTIGPTYTLGPQYASQDAQGNSVYCTPKGALNPDTSGGMARALAAGGVQGVQALYNNAHKTANDNTQTNNARKQAMMDCYGIALQNEYPEVFLVKQTVPYSQAQQVCAQYNSQVASTQNVNDAQAAGADWCEGGWVSDSMDATYPITTTLLPACGGGKPGVFQFSPAKNVQISAIQDLDNNPVYTVQGASMSVTNLINPSVSWAYWDPVPMLQTYRLQFTFPANTAIDGCTFNPLTDGTHSPTGVTIFTAPGGTKLASYSGSMTNSSYNLPFTQTITVSSLYMEVYKTTPWQVGVSRIAFFNNGTAPVNCYGARPSQSAAGSAVLPFNQTSWSSPQSS